MTAPKNAPVPPADAAPIPLDPRLTVEVASALSQALRGRQTAVLDASQVRHLGAAALQVLLMARRAMGAGLVLQDPSEAFRTALVQMGAETLLAEEAA